MLDYLYDFSPHLINKFQHIFALKKKLQTYFTIQVGSTEILTTRRSFGLEKLGGVILMKDFPGGEEIPKDSLS